MGDGLKPTDLLALILSSLLGLGVLWVLYRRSEPAPVPAPVPPEKREDPRRRRLPPRPRTDHLGD